MIVKNHTHFGPLIKLGPIRSPYSVKEVLGGEFMEGELDTIISPSGKVKVNKSAPKDVLSDTSDGVQ